MATAFDHEESLSAQEVGCLLQLWRLGLVLGNGRFNSRLVA
jgi:hypothetical protein